MDLKNYIRDIPDFPIKGILFHDVTTLFKNADAMEYVAKRFFNHFKNKKIDYVAAIEARGFVFGGILSDRLHCGFIPVRKPGKLPAETIREKYNLEYGTSSVEIHKDAIDKNDKILVIDDLVATGGTIMATVRLIEKLGGIVAGVAVIIDMPDLQGRTMLKNYDYFYLVEYTGN
jgi:adenine phosphoribosyltransferase